MKYKVIADVNSDYKDRLKSYKNYLIAKQKQKASYFASEWDPELDMTKEEVDAYNAGWDLAFIIARCNLEMWFPELKKEN